MASETKRRRWLPAPFSRRATIVWAVIVAVLLVAGAYFMYDRLANGLGMAGATNSVPWGLWVVVYIWFSGLAGGLYLLSALVYLLRIPRFAPVARMALGLSVVSLVVSMIFIGIDLGAIRHSLGTLLFFLSDLMLVFNQFARAGEIFDFLCLLLYYPAECFLALSVLFSRRISDR